MNYRFFVMGIFLMFAVQFSFASSNADSRRKEAETQDSIKTSVDYLKYFLERQGNWFPKDPWLEKNLFGLVHFVEDDKIDTVLYKLGQYKNNNQFYFYRSPSDVSDSLSVSGYLSAMAIAERLKRLDRSVKSNFVKGQISVPERLFKNMDSRIKFISSENAEWLVKNSKVTLPDSLKSYRAIPDSLMTNAADLKKLQRMDRARRAFLEKARIAYNDGLRKQYRDSVSAAYRQEYVNAYSRQVQKEVADSLKRNNFTILVHYNDSVMKAVNDSVTSVLRILTAYAENDSAAVVLKNSDNDSTLLWTRKNDPHFTRIFIKNEQNDSLGVRVENLGKNALRLFIDDGGVSLSRYTKRQIKDAKLTTQITSSKLQSVTQRYRVESPWTLTGNSNLGFTQTGITHWKSGGESALALLFTFKGTANYAKRNVTWNNTVELSDGWVKPGGGMLEKNEDELDIITRLGLKAAKSWNYSAEVTFQTQLFNGYNYPDRENIISDFLSPAYMNFKLGMDYTPSKNLSLLLSPISSKMIYVRDTAHVDVTDFGIDKGRKTYWQPGFNADFSWTKKISDDISFNTTYNMFINYLDPFSDLFDIDWQSKLIMQLNTFVNMTATYHAVYDNDVLFDDQTRWQMKDIITIGFNYKLNKQIYRRKKLK